MKTLSLLAAAALFSSVAAANAAEPVALTETQLDNVTAGDAQATLDLKTFSATGTKSASVEAKNVVISAVAVGGVYTASISGSFVAKADQ
jgi:hypothetical protein